jgi:hypothetical protein
MSHYSSRLLVVAGLDLDRMLSIENPGSQLAYSGRVRWPLSVCSRRATRERNGRCRIAALAPPGPMSEKTSRSKLILVR